MYLISPITRCTENCGPSRQRTLGDLQSCSSKTETLSQLLRKVLVVDDEADLAELAAILLQSHGLQTLTASSARAALGLLATDNEIDAVVSDIVMPGMTGLKLADAIREMYPRVKVVLTSGFTPQVQRMSQDCPYLFATKPYKVETLLKLLRS